MVLVGEISLTAGDTLTLTNSKVTASTSGQSDAGFIDVKGNEVKLEDTEVASTSTATNGGWAGDILIDGIDGVTIVGIENVGEDTKSILRTDTKSQRVNSEGTITVHSAEGEILVRNSNFTATTSGNSNAGFIELDGSAIHIEDSNIASRSTAEDSGAPGVITMISAQSLDIVRSNIDTNTSGARVIGLVENEDGDLVEGELVGNIVIVVSKGDLTVSDSEIASAASGESNAGFIDIDVKGKATIIGGPVDRTRITTRSEQSLGGDILLTVTDDLDIVGGFIEASAGGEKNGGNVELEALVIFVRDSGIYARGEKGNGGEIMLSVTGANQLFIIDSESEINADSGSGFDGFVDINAPDADLAASLQQQDANIVVAPELAGDDCSPAAVGNLSTFIQDDEGGTPLAPDRYLFASIRAQAMDRTNETASRDLLDVGELPSAEPIRLRKGGR